MHIIIFERIQDKSYLKSQFILNDLQNFRSDLVRISVLLNENLNEYLIRFWEVSLSREYFSDIRITF